MPRVFCKLSARPVRFAPGARSEGGAGEDQSAFGGVADTVS